MGKKDSQESLATAVDLSEESSSVARSETILETDNGRNNEGSLNDNCTEASLAVDSENIQTSGAVDKDVLKKLLFGTSHTLNLIHLLVIHSRCSLIIYFSYSFTSLGSEAN